MPGNVWTYRLAMCMIFLGIFMSATRAQGRIQSYEKELTGIFNRSKDFTVTINVSAVPSGKNSFVPSSNSNNYEIAVGSGFILDSLGHIITTSSVTDRGNLFRISFSDGSTRFGELVGTDFEHNISILKVNSPPFPPPLLADSDSLEPGRWIGIVGNFFGMFPSFAEGIASGVNNNGDILVTADISPGSAGGLVVNSDGRCVGMIAYKLTEPISLNSIDIQDQSKASRKSLVLGKADIDLPVGGYSLMVSSNRIRQTADEIISGNYQQGGFLGVVPENLDFDWAKRVFNINHGVYITAVQVKSPAYKAGIREGDILLKYGWHQILNSAQLRKLIVNDSPGSEVEISILRAGKIRNLKAVLGKFSPTAANAGSGQNSYPKPDSSQK